MQRFEYVIWLPNVCFWNKGTAQQLAEAGPASLLLLSVGKGGGVSRAWKGRFETLTGSTALPALASCFWRLFRPGTVA